jgi:hypothetical protein
VRAVALTIAASLALAIALALTRDPEEPWAVALFIVAVGVAAGAAATWLQLRRPGGRAGHARTRGVRGGSAVRRGVEVAVVVALLLWLRAVDGLSPITALFVLAAFIVAEAVLSARPHSSR